MFLLLVLGVRVSSMGVLSPPHPHFCCYPCLAEDIHVFLCLYRCLNYWRHRARTVADASQPPWEGVVVCVSQGRPFPRDLPSGCSLPCPAPPRSAPGKPCLPTAHSRGSAARRASLCGGPRTAPAVGCSAGAQAPSTGQGEGEGEAWRARGLPLPLAAELTNGNSKSYRGPWRVEGCGHAVRAPGLAVAMNVR